MANSYATIAASDKVQVALRARQVAFEHQEYTLALFSQPETDPEVRYWFLKIVQKRAVEYLKAQEAEERKKKRNINENADVNDSGEATMSDKSGEWNKHELLYWEFLHRGSFLVPHLLY